VSPLLALMRNQIAAAERAGIHATTINSTNTDDWNEIYGRVSRGEVDVLLLSPERLNNPEFRDAVLPALARSCGLLVVDEVHCISDWGHDFRPDYRRLRTLLPELPAGTPVLATTATANARVVDDVAEVLGLGHRTADVLVQRGSLDRQSLRLGVLQLDDHAHRLAWLVDHLAHWTGSGIIYTLTVAASQDVADHLRRAGHDVLAYSGQTAPEERLEAERALLDNRIKALVATSALGMGFDKPDLEFVVHLGAPQSPIAYYQQVGRAGRATDRADAILMPGDDDEAIWKYFDSMAFPREGKVRQVLATLSEADGPVTTPVLETTVDLRRSRLEAMLKVLDVDGAVRRVKGGWLATGSPWDYDAERYARVAEVRRHEQQAMRHYIATTDCRLEFLRQQLDDPEAGPCGRCDNCTNQPIGRETAETSVTSARRTLLQAGLTLEPKKLWPTNMDAFGIDVRGRIDATEGPEPGRALARLTGVGLGGTLRALLADEAPDGEITDELFEAVVEVMARWKEERPERPSAVVSIGSNRRPKLIASLARRIAAVGHLPHLGEVTHDGPSAGVASNSAHRFRSVWGAYALAPETEASLPDHTGKAILLVDDYLDTAWTMTVVARQLRQQGAGRVYPLVLAVTF